MFAELALAAFDVYARRPSDARPELMLAEVAVATFAREGGANFAASG
jgi:hypothetical protein